MHHTHATAPHATLACIAEKRLLHNRTHSLRRRKHATGGKRVVGDITQEREKGRSASAQDGVGLCTTPMPQLSRNPRMHCRKTPFAQPYSRAETKEACHGREACCGRHNPRERERKVSKCIRWGRSVHHTHATAPHATLACIAEKRLLHNRTHSLRRRKHATGGKRVVGDITQEREKGRSASAQDGTGLCTTPMP